MSFLKTVESYQQGARTLPGRYYKRSGSIRGEQDRVFARTGSASGVMRAWRRRVITS